MSSSNCCFLTCIEVSQGAGQVVWYSLLFQNFPQFIVIHTVKGFVIVNKAEIDVKQKILRRGGKNTPKNCTKKDLHDQDNHDSVITHLEPDILECEVKWALGSITTSKASGGDGIPVELFQILKDDAVKGLHSICQQIWKTQQRPQDWKRSVFFPIPKKGQRSKFLSKTKLYDD